MTKLICQQELSQLRCPQGLKEWMHARGSLTQKIAHYSHDTRIQLIQNDWARTTWWDLHVLDIRPQTAFIREILMMVDGRPWWYARTLIPKRTFEQKSALFQQLNTTSLGNILFNDDKIRRVDLIYYPIDKNYIEYHWALKETANDPKILWSRRTVFDVNEFPLYLMEIFLPSMLERVCTN